jgi:hypothetical protein
MIVSQVFREVGLAIPDQVNHLAKGGFGTAPAQMQQSS